MDELWHMISARQPCDYQIGMVGGLGRSGRTQLET